MSKIKSSDKNHYEMLYIIPNKFTEDETKKIDEKVEKMITDLEGEITYSEQWGKKKLAYPIKNYNHGYYNLFEFDLWGKDLKELDTLLRMSSKVLRHQVVRTVKRTEEEIKKDKKKSEEMAKKEETEEEAKISSPKVEKKEETVISKEIKREKEQDDKKKKTDLKDLDKKLDDILKTDDLL